MNRPSFSSFVSSCLSIEVKPSSVYNVYRQYTHTDSLDHISREIGVSEPGPSPALRLLLSTRSFQ